MAKIRVYELAKELGRDNKTLVKVVKDLGIEIKNQMSTLSPDQADRVRRELGAPAGAPGGQDDKEAAGASGAPSGRRRRRNAVVPKRRKGSGVRPADREREKDDEEAAAEPADAPTTPTATPRSTVRPVVRAANRGAEAGGETQVRRAVPEVRRPSGRPAGAESAPDGRGGVAARSDDGGASHSARGGDVAPAAEDAAGRPPVGPKVGDRIELPKRTRRLPGGMLDRLEKEPVRETGAAPSRAPSAESASGRAEPAPSPAEPEPEAGQAPAADEAVTAEGTREEIDAKGRRVIRNEDGVIVGVKTKQQGPNIVDFINLQPRPKPRQQVIITEANKGPGGGRASARKKREERHQQMGRRRPQSRNRQRSGPPQRSTQEMSEAKKRIRVDEAIQVSEMAHQMGQKASKLLRELWSLGLKGITINHAIDFETAELVAEKFGYKVEDVGFSEDELIEFEEDEEEDSHLRPPVVTVMGHVDHGKTSLLDYIRSANVASGEAGGITQHIGAYKVNTYHGDVVFLDTPGHEAFSSMRSRGAQLTDIVVLIVAADDGVMPTTIEAIKHAKEAQTPMIVAINKVDKPEANPGRVKQMLMEHGLVGSEFGGETEICEISAKTGQGVEELLELLAVQAEVMDLRARDLGRASGTVIEARMDKGRGPVATVLVQSGMLERGDVVVADEFTGKIRGMFDDRGQKLKTAGPGTPVEVLGMDGVPSAGDRFDAVENDRAAKQLVSYRREKRRRKESARSGPSVLDLIAKKNKPTLKIVLRADVQGSAEALRQSLEDLSTEKVKVEVIYTGVGAINENDVKFASAGTAIVIGFNVKPVGKAASVAESEGVRIEQYKVIYNATEAVMEMMIDLLEPEYREVEQGEAEVRALFPIPRLGVVAGCRVLKGKITRSSHCRVRRNGKVIHSGKIGSLRVFKDDVREVSDGQECGIVVQGFPDVQPEDVIEAFEVETLRPSLD